MIQKGELFFSEQTSSLDPRQSSGPQTAMYRLVYEIVYDRYPHVGSASALATNSNVQIGLWTLAI